MKVLFVALLAFGSIVLFSSTLKAEELSACLDCHQGAIPTQERTIPSIFAKIQPPSMSHFGMMENDCSYCHTGHFEQPLKQWQLTNAYPQKFVNSYVKASTENTYALCFQCHTSEMLDDGAPYDITSFRKDKGTKSSVSSRNLHQFHVVEKKWSCRVCHDPHGSTLIALLRDKAGPSLRTLNFEQRPFGGKCAGMCHYVNEKTYQMIGRR